MGANIRAILIGSLPVCARTGTLAAHEPSLATYWFAVLPSVPTSGDIHDWSQTELMRARIHEFELRGGLFLAPARTEVGSPCVSCIRCVSRPHGPRRSSFSLARFSLRLLDSV